jgi:hypothetical protein
MAYGFALAILKEQGLRAKYLGKRSKIDHNGSNGYEFINLNGNLFQPKPEYNRTFTSPFTYHIPYLKIKQFRVELTNKRKGLKDGIILFSPMIQYSSGKKARVLKLNINNSLFDKIRIPITDRWRISRIVRKINSHYQLQKNYCLTLSHRQINGDIGPIELLESVKRILNEESYNRPNRYIEYQSSDGMDFKIPYKIIAGYKILKMIIKALK